MTANQTAPLLELSGVTKHYGKLVANDAISMAIGPGEIHAVLGENGAGKSTLMKIIFGVTSPNEGEIKWNGKPVRIKTPAQARALGIGMVFQHFSLFETISVVENISLTVNEPLDQLSERIRQKSVEFGLSINPEALVHGLSVGERQRVEIMRCLLQEPRLLILDEPTSVLPLQNIEQLFNTLRKLSDSGIAILYISHKLEEIRSLCHSATVLRHGQVTGHATPADSTPVELATMMIGREIPHAAHPPATEDGEIRLSVSRLDYVNPDPHAIGLKDVSFQVRAGEIVGVAGISGNGQGALSKLLSGEELLPSNDNGLIEIMGKNTSGMGPNQRREIGLGFVPEERLGRGAAPPMSLADNGLLTGYRKNMVKRGLVQRKTRDDFSVRCIDDMDVRAQGHQSLATSLSGGNLQKFIMAREILLEPKVLVVAQPTWGIDVGAAAVVRQKLIDLRDTGTAILVISEELEELFEISDRLVVMFDGRLSNPVRTRETNAEEIGQLMIGEFELATATQGQAAAE